MEMNWPTAALVLGLAAILAFRAQLAALLDRTEKVKDWLVAPKQNATNALSAAGSAETQKQVEALTAGFNNQLLASQEERIIADVQTHALQITTPLEGVLIKHLAGAQIVLHFERTYNTIYGSQVRALRWLNAAQRGVAASELKPFFDEAKQRFEALYSSYEFRQWLIYLATQGLIVDSEESRKTGPDEEPTDIQITVAGREFLKFLVDQGRVDPGFG